MNPADRLSGMRTALFRAFLFSVTVLVVVLTYEVLVFELPPRGGSIYWEQRLSLHVALTAVLVATGFIGSVVGFSRSRRGYELKATYVAALAVLFLVLALAIALPITLAEGLLLGTVTSIALATATSWLGDRHLSKNVASVRMDVSS